jgi:Fic family protein
VRSSIARKLGLDIAGAVPSERHVDGVVEMMLDATQRYQQPLSPERLCGWHSALFPTGMSGLYVIEVGHWRTDAKGPMQVISGNYNHERVHYEAPAAARLEREMRLFLAWVNQEPDIDPVLVAAIAHFWFITIHPFDDGNGRIARAVADWALARSEGSAQRFYSMSSQIRVERSDYYDMLEQSQKGGVDITDWVTWFLGCLGRAIRASETTLGGVLAKAKFWDVHAAKPLNERQRLMLNKLLDSFEGKLTSTKWAKMAKTSQDTAQRDIQGLIDMQVMRKDEAGGRSTSYSVIL